MVEFEQCDIISSEAKNSIDAPSGPWKKTLLQRTPYWEFIVLYGVFQWWKEFFCGRTLYRIHSNTGLILPVCCCVGVKEVWWEGQQYCRERWLAAPISCIKNVIGSLKKDPKTKWSLPAPLRSGPLVVVVVTRLSVLHSFSELGLSGLWWWWWSELRIHCR